MTTFDVSFIKPLARTAENINRAQVVFENQTGLKDGEGVKFAVDWDDSTDIPYGVWGFISDAGSLLFLEDRR